MRLKAYFDATEATTERKPLFEQVVAISYFASIIVATGGWLYVLGRGATFAIGWMLGG